MASTSEDADTTVPVGMDNRQLTVMFVDLVGSTKLSQKLDPEDLMALTLRYQQIVKEAITPFRGKISRLVGDGVLVLFGWPKAHENDPERAIRAAIEIHARLAGIEGVPGGLSCHIGIATGVVLVGNRSAEPGQPEQVFGETPNLASRLQDLASSGETVIADATHKCIENTFQCEPLDPVSLNGFTERVTAHRVLHERADMGRTWRVQRTDKTRLVGRQDQLAILQEKWDLARNGKGQVVLISGEPGIGKSRLLAEQRTSASLGPHNTIIYHCSPFHENSAFHPIIEQVARWADLAPDDDLDARTAKVSAKLAGDIDERDLTLITALFVGSKAFDSLVDQMSEQQFRDTIRRITYETWRAYAMRKPLLINFEDLHWIDSSSQILLESMATLIADLPLLLVVSHRPEFDDAAFEGPHVTRIDLEPLARDDAVDLISTLRDGTVAATTVEEILALTSGVPLYIEEFTASLADRPAAEHAAAAPIPVSIYDLLTAKLDDTGPNRPILLACAAIGRAVDAELIATLFDLSEEDALAKIFDLVERGLLISGSTQTRFHFRHALVREAAYRSLLKEQRGSLHAKIAAFIQEWRPATAAQEPEFLASHWQRGGKAEPAIACYIRAAQQNLRRFAHREAIQHAQSGLGLIDQLDVAVGEKLKLRLLFLSATAKWALRGYGDQEAVTELETAVGLAEAQGDLRTFMRAGKSLFAGYQVQARFTDAEAFGRRVPEIVQGNQAQMVAHYMIAVPLMWRGRFQEAASQLATAQGFAQSHIAEKETGRQDTATVNQIAILSCLVRAFLGVEDVRAEADILTDQARATKHPLTIATAVHVSCMIYQMLHDPHALQLSEELGAVAEKNDLGFYIASATSHIGGGLMQNGDVRRGYQLLRKGLGDLHDTGCSASGGFIWYELARGCLMLGNHREGLEAIQSGLTCAERYDERNFEAELHRIHGELLLAQGQTERGVSALRQAVKVAQRQDARLFELRTQISLADVLTGAEARRCQDRIATLRSRVPPSLISASMQDALSH